MSTTKREKDPAPAAIRYLVLASAFTCLLTSITFIQVIFGSSTTEEQFYQSAFSGFIFISFVSMIEWFLLRRSRKMLGPYGFAFVVEIIKSLLFGFATIMYSEHISSSSTSPFFLPQIISYAILFLLALTKIARTRIDQLAQKDASRHLLNLLPTILILTLFLGTYFTEIAGLGTPRQRQGPFEDYIQKNIDWSMYNTPTWDATYLLENLLDQFTAGIQFPNDPLFNVTSNLSPNNPAVYWRLGTLESYEYTGKAPYSTDWNPVTRGKRVLTPYTTGTPYSSMIDSSDRSARFTVSVPLDHSDSLVDVSVNPSFQNHLPTTLNGENGSYIDANDFTLYEANGIELTTTSDPESREVYPNDYGEDIQDLLGIDANIVVDETSSEEGILEYINDYADLSQIMFTAATFSLTKDDYDTILSPTEWDNIQDLYLQLPEAGELPQPSYNVHGSTFSTGGSDDYSDWAPWVVGNATICTTPGQSVFSIAYAEMQRIVPRGYIQNGVEQNVSGINYGKEFNFTFDQDMWLGNQNPLQDMAHPDQYEDYNEWFIERKSGVSLHFASLLATFLRIRGIPSRVVIGYLGGEDQTNPDIRIITNSMLHAWTEVLIPVGGLHQKVEWISFDPLLEFIAQMTGVDAPTGMPSLSQSDQTVLIDPYWNHIDNGPYDSLAVWQTCDSNDTLSSDPYVLNTTQNLTISVRVMMLTGGNSWMPWQPSCKYLGTQIDFELHYISSNQNITIGPADIDASGIASIELYYDFAIHGDTVKFFASITLDNIRKTAISPIHSIFPP